jgi:flagellar basal-body rod protein FlgB
MLEKLFGPHMDNLQQAMSRTTQRHSMLSNNLANVNTPGYKRKDVDFNIVLEEERGKQAFFNRGSEEISDNSSLRLDGNNVDVEKEVMQIAETELRFAALTDMTAGYFAGLKNVIREGR